MSAGGVTDTGSPYMRTLGTDIDIRTDVPSYYVYRHGLLDDTATDISALWNDQMVGLHLAARLPLSMPNPSWHPSMAYGE